MLQTTGQICWFLMRRSSPNHALEHSAPEKIVPFTTGKSVFYRPGPMYRLEKQMEPNVAVDLDSTLESQSTLEFCLVRENSKYAR